MKVVELNKAQELAGGVNVSKSGNRLSQNERFLLAAADKFEPEVPSNWAVVPDSLVEAVNALSAASPTANVGSPGAAKTVSASYDFSVQGGAIGTINLNVAIPDNAIILEVIQDTLVTVVGAGSTAQFQVGAVAISNTIVGDAVGVSAAGAAVPLKITTPADISLVVSSAVLTAGKVRIFVRYVISE